MIGFPVHRRARLPTAFTLVEALVSISIMAIAASALLLGTTSSFQTTTEALEETIARGMAQQLMDDVVGCRYMEPGGSPYDVTLGPDAGEQTRDEFDDIDDYNGYRSTPPVDAWGIELGKDDGEGGERCPSFQVPVDFFQHWQQAVDVYYVEESDLTTRLPAGQTSDYRAVEVRIVNDHPERGSRELARLRRIVTYVPPM